jgi:hypothetical protein
MKDKLENHLKNQQLISDLKESHGYPVYPISKDDFEDLLKKAVDSDQEENLNDSQRDWK